MEAKVDQSRTLMISSISELPDIPCSQVHARSLPDNTERIWIGVNCAARQGGCWWLEPGEPWTFKVQNVNRLDVLIVDEDEKDKLILLVEAL